MQIEFTQDFQEHKAGEQIEVKTFTKLLQQCFVRGIVKEVEVTPVVPIKCAVNKKAKRKAVTR